MAPLFKTLHQGLLVSTESIMSLCVPGYFAPGAIAYSALVPVKCLLMSKFFVDIEDQGRSVSLGHLKHDAPRLFPGQTGMFLQCCFNGFQLRLRNTELALQGYFWHEA